MSEITHILQRVEKGDRGAVDLLLPLVYQELRRLAARKMAGEKAGHTLQATALVHEAWLRLGGAEQPTWQNRGHFFAAAAEAMRRILIDRARRHQASRHGGGLERVNLDDVELSGEADNDEHLLALNDALERYAEQEPAKAALVKLRYFAGLTIEETAMSLGISEPTAKRWWAYSRAWLYREVKF